MAIQDDESRVRFSGYDPTDFKVLVFAVSAGLAGIAGALYFKVALPRPERWILPSLSENGDLGGSGGRAVWWGRY